MPSSPAGLRSAPHSRTGSATVVLIASGAIGVAFGLRYATWQWAVELGQVTAGIVHYERDAPTTILHWHLWSVVDQLTALALRSGVSERALSWLLSALVGMVSAQALATLTFALTRAVLPALLVPLVLMSVDLTAYGPSYPLMLVGLPHTYGMLGLSVAMLALGLVGSGWRMAGAGLAGLAIAIQLPLGVAVSASIVGATLWRRERVSRGPVVAFVAGLGIAAVSYAVFLRDRVPVAHVDSETAHRFLQAFVQFWDAHRMPVRWRSRGVVLSVVVLIFACVWTTRTRSAASRLMLTALALAAAASLLLAGLTWIDPARLPDVVVVAMPARLINISVFAAGPLLAAAAVHVIERIGAARISLLTPLYSVAIVVTATLSVMFPVARLAAEPMSLRIDDPVWSVAAGREGPLLTGADIWLAQLRTRRPVLLEGATLDTLPYALDAAPTVERILRSVYGQSLLEPPPDAGRRGQVASGTSRRVWEQYGLAEWTRIRQEFGVTDVLTRADWPLQLPVVAASPTLRLYAIPR